MQGQPIRRPAPCVIIKKDQVYLRHTECALTVAPFRAWRGSQPLVAQGLVQ